MNLKTERLLRQKTRQTETSLSDGAALITSANDEYYDNDGKLSEETLDKFSGLCLVKSLVEAYLEVQNTDAFKQAQLKQR